MDVELNAQILFRYHDSDRELVFETTDEIANWAKVEADFWRQFSNPENPLRKHARKDLSHYE